MAWAIFARGIHQACRKATTVAWEGKEEDVHQPSKTE